MQLAMKDLEILFPIGDLYTTSSIKDSLSLPEIMTLVNWHRTGNFGTISKSDKETNKAAIKEGDRILSAYLTSIGNVWVITEADRSSTTVLLPEEY